MLFDQFLKEIFILTCTVLTICMKMYLLTLARSYRCHSDSFMVYSATVKRIATRVVQPGRDGGYKQLYDHSTQMHISFIDDCISF